MTYHCCALKCYNVFHMMLVWPAVRLKLSYVTLGRPPRLVVSPPKRLGKDEKSMEIVCAIRGSTWRRTEGRTTQDHHTPRDQLPPLETASELAASWLDHRKSPALDPNENADADFRPPFLMRKLSKKTDQLIALDTRYIIRMYIIY